MSFGLSTTEILISRVFPAVLAGSYAYIKISEKIKENDIKLTPSDLMKLAGSLNCKTWISMASSAYLFYEAYNCYANPHGLAMHFNEQDSSDRGCYDRDDPQNEAYKAMRKTERVHHGKHHHKYDLEAPKAQAPAPVDPNKQIAGIVEPFEVEVFEERIMQEIIEEVTKNDLSPSADALRETFHLDPRPGSNIV